MDMKNVLKSIMLCLSLMWITSACAPTQWFTTYEASVDYYKAGLDGKVFITESNSVSFDYIPIGSIYIYQEHGYIKNSESPSMTVVEGDPIYGTTERKEYYGKKKDFRWATYESVLRAASERAIEMEGDGIINIKLSLRPDKNNRNVLYPAVEGMVIKRK